MAVMRNLGLKTIVFPKADYDDTGSAVSFNNGSQAQRSAHISIKNHSGLCQISLDGNASGDFIELEASDSFSFPLQTQSIFIKSGVAGVVTKVSVVVGLHPIDSKIL